MRLSLLMVTLYLMYHLGVKGNYSQWLEAKAKRFEEEKKNQSAAAKAVSIELEWIRSNPKAKGNKSKARLKRYDELLLAAAPQEMRNEGQIYIPPGPRLGDVVIDVQGVRKSFGDRMLIDNLEFNLPKAGIVGVIGKTYCCGISNANMYHGGVTSFILA